MSLSYVLVCVAILLLVAPQSDAQGISDLTSRVSEIHPSGRAALPAHRISAGTDDDPLTFHNGANLECSHCHIIHASAQHPHDGTPGPDPFGAYPQSFTPSPKLLKAGDPVALCLTCHDNFPGVPDVVNADVNGLTDRSAGHFDSPGEDNPRGHKLEYGLVTADFELCMRCHFSGTFATASVTCIDCHNPHGNGRPRNLQWASYPGGEPQFGLLQDPGATGLTRYESASVAYGTSNTEVLREVSNMCLDCHHVLSGESYIDPDGDGIHELHPTYDSERSSPNNIAQGGTEGSTDPAHWVAGTEAGFRVTARLRFVNDGATDFGTAHQVNAAVNGVFCLSCHRAHGGDHAFGLRWNPASGVNGEGCDQCHNRAGQ